MMMSHTSFWLHHLEDGLEATFRRKISLYDFRCENVWYTAKNFSQEAKVTTMKWDESIKIETLTDFDDPVKQTNIIKYFTSPYRTQKTKLWQEIDNFDLMAKITRF